MPRLPFVKMHGIGNDYVYMDAVTDPGIEQLDLPALARRVSDRHTGIGSDGLILLCRPRGEAHVRMRMFNKDGSEGEMCGNGIRCVAKFAHDRLGIRARPMLVETGRGVLVIDYETHDGRLTTATADMGEPVFEASRIPVELPRATSDGRVIDVPLAKYIPMGEPGSWLEDCEIDARMTCVSTGNPHVVIFCGCVAAVPLESLGSYLERQPIFPDRANVHFAQVLSSNEVRMRTWERGSGITMACGTGASAVLVAGAVTGRIARETLVHLPGGDLHIRWDQATNHVFMTGPAVDVFEGTIEV